MRLDFSDKGEELPDKVSPVAGLDDEGILGGTRGNVKKALMSLRARGANQSNINQDLHRANTMSPVTIPVNSVVKRAR